MRARVLPNNTHTHTNVYDYVLSDVYIMFLIKKKNKREALLLCSSNRSSSTTASPYNSMACIHTVAGWRLCLHASRPIMYIATWNKLLYYYSIQNGIGGDGGGGGATVIVHAV